MSVRSSSCGFEKYLVAFSLVRPSGRSYNHCVSFVSSSHRTAYLRDYAESVEGRLPDAMAECISMIQTVIDELPTANYNVLRYICDHLVQASTHEDITNMAEGNFAICFGQTILTPPDDQAAIMATGYANRFVNILLNNVSSVAPPALCLLPILNF